MIYKELVKKRMNEKRVIISDRKTDNWKKIIDSTNRLINYMLVTRTRISE